MATVTVKNVSGTPLEVDRNNNNDWYTVDHGDTVDVEHVVAHGDKRRSGLLDQPDNWVKPGQVKRRTPKPRVPKGPKPPAPADETPTPPAGDQED